MARKRAHNTDGTFTPDDASTPETNEAWVEKVEATAPVEAELKSPTEEPKAPAAAPEKEEIETDVRKKLLNRTENEDVFVPAPPAVLEAAAKQVAEKEGFQLNRGTSIGARLMARSRKLV